MHDGDGGTSGKDEDGGSTPQSLSDQQITIEKINDQHKIAEFVCASHAKSSRVQDFLHSKAHDYERKNFARTFVARLNTEPSKVLGYYTLSAATLIPTKLSKSQQKTGPGSIDFPMVKLGFMGRCGEMPVGEAFKDFGSTLLYDAALRVRKIDAIGIWGFVLDAEVGGAKPATDKLVKWYADHKFQAIADQQAGAHTFAMYAKLDWLLA